MADNVVSAPSFSRPVLKLIRFYVLMNLILTHVFTMMEKESIENSECVASYVYDAWGNHTVTNYTSENIGNINPFRYRGYYYDSETNFYYLNSRYYSPEIKRFINADSINYLGVGDSLKNFNLYVYCGNNPVMGYDPMGTWDWKSIVTASLVVLATAALAAATVFTCGAALGAVGVIAATTVTIAKVATVTAGAAIIAGAFNIVEQTKEKTKEEELDYGETSLSAASGAARCVSSYVFGGAGIFASAFISAGEGALKASRKGATKEQIIDESCKSFAETFISYVIGWGADQYFGTKIFTKIVNGKIGGEVFSGVMNSGG